jgi:hypothetical protein
MQFNYFLRARRGAKKKCTADEICDKIFICEPLRKGYEKRAISGAFTLMASPDIRR